MNASMTPCLIRPAITEDIDPILNLVDQHNLLTKSPERILEEGFLMSGYEPELYSRWLAQLRVATINDEVVGFTLRFWRSEMPLEVDDFSEIMAEADGADFLLFKQVGVSINHQKMGIGRNLYTDDLERLSCPAFAPIIIAPVKNVVSIGFHSALGFQCARTYHIGGKQRGLWCRLRAAEV